MIRQIGSNKPTKLNLSGLISSQSLDFILSGIKNSHVVQELNLGSNMLNDEDLTKICQRLRAQGNDSLKRLKLASNEFKEPWAFIDLLSETGEQYTHLDFSKMSFSVPQSIDLLANSIVNLTNIQELSMCSLEMFSGGM